MRIVSCFSAWLVTLVLLAPAPALAKKITLNPSNQTGNAVSGGGNEAQYALIYAKLAKTILAAAGHSVVVDQDFYNAPKNANSWGADIFISLHTNAGGGHGIETLYLSTGGKTLADKVQNGLLAKLPYQNRGLVRRTDLHVLNSTNMYACLTEALFHDCSKTSGYQGHPPSESSFLRSADGQKKIAEGIAAGACAYFGSTCASSAVTPTPSKGFLKGAVYRAPNLADRILGATVKLNSGQTLKVDTKGLFTFELAPGEYTVTASAPGFKSGTSKATVAGGKDIWASVGLQPDDTTPPVVTDLGSGGADQDAGEPGAGGDGAGFLWPDAGRGGVDPQPRPEGCGCAVTAAQPSTGLLLLLLVLLGLIRRRRR